MSKYSELLRALADGKRLETAYAGSWHPMTEAAAIDRMARCDDIEWREAPKMMQQVQCEVPAPMKKPPRLGDAYFCPSHINSAGYIVFTWQDDGPDKTFFEKGLCYAVAEDAIARARAMLKIEPV